MIAPTALIVISKPMPSLRLVTRFRIAPGTNVDAPSSRPTQNSTSAEISRPDQSKIRPARNATPEKTGTMIPRSPHQGRPASSISSPAVLAGSCSQAHAALTRQPPHRSSQGPCMSSPRKRSEEHTSELQSRGHLVCRLLLEKKKPSEEMLYTEVSAKK